MQRDLEPGLCQATGFALFVDCAEFLLGEDTVTTTKSDERAKDDVTEKSGCRTAFWSSSRLIALLFPALLAETALIRYL